ncbi:MAG: hypothetical protein OK439_00345 [Thaumarchaeota archaeon]|nr:hypothetical protein [Nitrososphaerota archaeon]
MSTVAGSSVGIAFGYSSVSLIVVMLSYAGTSVSPKPAYIGRKKISVSVTIFLAGLILLFLFLDAALTHVDRPVFIAHASSLFFGLILGLVSLFKFPGKLSLDVKGMPSSSQFKFRKAEDKDQSNYRFPRCSDADFVLERANDVIGHALANEDGQALVISNFEIRNDVRDQDLGTLFEMEFERFAKRLGKSELVAFDVGDDSKGFWEKKGFSFLTTDQLDRDSWHKII